MKKYRFDSPKEKFVLSWNGDQTSTIYIRAENERIKYADRFATYSYSGELLQVDIDEIECSAPTFEVEANVERLYISTLELESSRSERVMQNVGQLRSQLTLDHPRFLDLCSPTSCANMIEHLMGIRVDLHLFAEECYDREHKIYGNWPLCVAATYPYIKERYQCYVSAFQGWAPLINLLEEGGGVIMSVKGRLKNAPKPYFEGHLMMVYGIDLSIGKLYAIDPAAEECNRVYDLEEVKKIVRVLYLFSVHT